MIKRNSLIVILFIFLFSACQAALDFDEKPFSPTLDTLPAITPIATSVVDTLSFKRLAEPTLPSAPTQADYGAHVYWMWCLPCHGDRGQGLTDEFREVYPPEDQYCWERGCHGERPYDDGFTLPLNVPTIIGVTADMEKFPTAASLNTYILETMPYWNPGALTEEENWQVTAFLLRENGIYYDEINEFNADNISLSIFQPMPTLSTSRTVTDGNEFPRNKQIIWGIVVLLICIVFIALLFFSRTRSSR